MSIVKGEDRGPTKSIPTMSKGNFAYMGCSAGTPVVSVWFIFCQTSQVTNSFTSLYSPVQWNLCAIFLHVSLIPRSPEEHQSSRTWKHQFKRREPLSNQYPRGTNICTGSSRVAMTFTRFFCLFTYASPLSTSIKSDRHLMAFFWSVMNSLGQHLHMVCVRVCACVRVCMCACALVCEWARE